MNATTQPAALETIAHRTMCAALALVEREHAAAAMRRLAKANGKDRVRRPGHGTERSQAVEIRRARRALKAAARWEAQARAFGLA